MGLDLHVSCDNQDGTFTDIPIRFTRYRWFWERLCPELIDKKIKGEMMDSISPSISNSLRECPSQIPKIRKIFENDFIGDGIAYIGTYISVEEFLTFHWSHYWSLYLSQLTDKKLYTPDHPNYKQTFDTFYKHIKKNVPRDGILYFHWDLCYTYYDTTEDYAKANSWLKNQVRSLEEKLSILRNTNAELLELLKEKEKEKKHNPCEK